MASTENPDLPRPSFPILVAISAIGPLSLNLLIPSMPSLERGFAVPYGTVQLTLTLYLIGMAVCQVFYGPASDRFGRRPLLLLGLSVFFLASLLAAVAPTIEILIVARLFQAIGGSAGIVLARAMIRDVYPREKAASVISYVTMAFAVAPMLAPVLGGLLEAYANWRIGFWLLASAGAAVLASAWRKLPETHHHRAAAGGATSFFSNALLLARNRSFRCYALTASFTSGVFYAFLGGAPHIMIDVLKRSPMEYGLWYATISVTYMAGNYLSGTYTQTYGIDRMITLGNIICLGGGALCFAAAAADFVTPLTLFIPMSIAGFGNGLTVPNSLAGAISVEPRLTGSAAGWAGFAQMVLGSAVSQLVGSWQASWPLLMFWVMAACSLAALLEHWRGNRKPLS
jgi:DHA1 family bicyclomycin/chloramphenicol resistance-like MFS transporter